MIAIEKAAGFSMVNLLLPGDSLLDPPSPWLSPFRTSRHESSLPEAGSPEVSKEVRMANGVGSSFPLNDQPTRLILRTGPASPPHRATRRRGCGRWRAAGWPPFWPKPFDGMTLCCSTSAVTGFSRCWQPDLVRGWPPIQGMSAETELGASDQEGNQVRFYRT